jgi:maltooligosyltrehalose synthase
MFRKVATEEVNYRRFFNVNVLISLRMEDEAVFKKTHALIVSLAREFRLTGLRIDHVDGLYDPEDCLRRLRAETPDAFVVVEKILRSTATSWRLMALLPVYRTYVRQGSYSEEDRAVMKEAVGKAKKSAPALEHEFDFIDKFLGLADSPYLTEEQKRLWPAHGPFDGTGF